MLDQWLASDFYMGLSPMLVAFALGALTLLFEDVALLFGVAVVHQKPDILPAVFTGLFVGILIGDFLLYGLGRWFNHVAFVKRQLERFGLNKNAVKFQQHFLPMLVICRAIPASRLPTFVAAGVLKINAFVFIAIVGISGFIWVGVILYGGVNLSKYLYMMLGFSPLWFILILVGSLIFVLLAKRYRKTIGRAS